MDNKGNNNNGNNNNNNNNNRGGNNKNGMTIMVFVLAALLVLFLTSLLNSCARDATNKEITYSEFVKMVEEDKVEEVTFTSSRIKITPKGQDTALYRISYYTAELRDEELLPLLKEHNVKFGGTVEDVSTTIMWNLVSYILPLVLVWVLLYFLIFRKMGGGGMMGVGKTTAKVYVEKSTGVTFKDVAGQDEAKESLQEVVDFLHNPKRYIDIGAKLPKGALLVGPPGTGKTLLAKAVAGEANVPFFSLAGSDFVEMFVGVGASRVRDLFKEAQKQAPCIIFIDEIDAIGKSRDTRYGGNDEREQTLNQLLAEMDGFDTSKGLLILAATNRPEVLDKALLRPGRFDRRIIVDKPDLKGRVETLKVHAKDVLMDESVDLDAIALATSGAVGSDLANMINEAAINAVKQGRKFVNQADLFESVEVVIAGKEKKDRIMGPKEKKMVAYHEVGHALVTALQKDTEPVQKITIVPRTMGALGYTMQVPEEEKYLMTRNELMAHLVTYMGGRAAEEIVFDSVTTGASNDIEQATKMARAMVTQYGMSEKFGLMGLVTVESQYLDGRASLNCGEETAAQIDQEVMRILKECYDKAIRLLQENRSILDEISQYLYEHETITGKEFMKIFRDLKGIPEPEEKTDAEKAAEEFKAEGSLPKKSWNQGYGREERRGQGESPMEAYVREREEGRSATEALFGRKAARREEYLEMGVVPKEEPAQGLMLPMGDVPEEKSVSFETVRPEKEDFTETAGFSREMGTLSLWKETAEPDMAAARESEMPKAWEGAGELDTPQAWQDIRRGIASRTKSPQGGETFTDVLSTADGMQDSKEMALTGKAASGSAGTDGTGKAASGSADADVTAKGSKGSAGTDVTAKGSKGSADADVTAKAASGSAGADVMGKAASGSAGANVTAKGSEGSADADVTAKALAGRTEGKETGKTLAGSADADGTPKAPTVDADRTGKAASGSAGIDGTSGTSQGFAGTDKAAKAPTDPAGADGAAKAPIDSAGMNGKNAAPTDSAGRKGNTLPGEGDSQGKPNQGPRVENLRDAFMVAALQEESLQNIQTEENKGNLMGKEGAKQKGSGSKKKSAQKKDSLKEETPAKGKKAQGKGKNQKGKSSVNKNSAKEWESALDKAAEKKEADPSDKIVFAEGEEEPPTEIYSQREDFSQGEGSEPSGREDYLDQLLKGMK